MDRLDELLEIDEALARGAGDDYRARLADDAIVVLPGLGPLDRESCAAAVDAAPGPPWGTIRMTDARLADGGDGAVAVAYRFEGERGGTTYAAWMSSVYVRGADGWRLLLHQQTPIEG